MVLIRNTLSGVRQKLGKESTVNLDLLIFVNHQRKGLKRARTNSMFSSKYVSQTCPQPPILRFTQVCKLFSYRFKVGVGS